MIGSNQGVSKAGIGQTPILRLEGVTKRIGSRAIVDHLSFEIGGGEVVGLLGPNGAGKTTTIRMIVGLIGMNEGDIYIAGQSVRANHAAAMKCVGGIIENPEFYPYMSGYDNLKQYQRMTPGVSEERMLEVIRLVGLTDAMGRKVKGYSLGMRQRLGIAQALLHRPKLLILDEPTNGLDPAGIREMREYLKRIATEEGISVLVSSHLLAEIELMCHRVVVIQEGKLVTVQSLAQEAKTTVGIHLELRVAAEHRELARGLLAMRKDVQLLEQAEGGSEGLAFSSLSGVQVGAPLFLQAAEAVIPELIAQLAAERVRIHRLEEHKVSLEDEFLKWTGGNRIA
ncbi:ABC transporter ATP-binding protein [Gorillibacterium sp. CAU 1737]|uniref:ABC transporter ATP-binding protein n=1 Tax=Gorillibacterium sp. CAU 1737 TaxID=3140362 RepID=UPI003260DA14